MVDSIAETLNKSTFWGKPVSLCNAKFSKIKDFSRVIALQEFPACINQQFLSSRERIEIPDKIQKVIPA
jgi:hypothetical protein